MIEAFPPTVRQEPGNSQGSGQGDVSFSNTTVILQETEMLENASCLTLTFGPFARCVLPTLQILS